MEEGPGTLVSEFGGREARFGSALLRESGGEVYFLSLFEIEDPQVPGMRAIAGRGYWLPPAGSYALDYPPVGIAQIEIIAGVESLEQVEQAVGERSVEAPFFEQEDPNGPFAGLVVLAGLLPPIGVVLSAPQRNNDRVTAWTGNVRGPGESNEQGDVRELDFVVEQYGSIEPVLYLVTLLYFSFDWVRDMRDRPLTYWECKREANEMCGEGNVKAFGFSGNSSIGASVGVSAGASAGGSIGTGSGCNFECFEPRKLDTAE